MYKHLRSIAHFYSILEFGGSDRIARPEVLESGSNASFFFSLGNDSVADCYRFSSGVQKPMELRGIEPRLAEINVVIARAKADNMHTVTKLGKKRRQMYGHVFTALSSSLPAFPGTYNILVISPPQYIISLTIQSHSSSISFVAAGLNPPSLRHRVFIAVFLTGASFTSTVALSALLKHSFAALEPLHACYGGSRSSAYAGGAENDGCCKTQKSCISTTIEGW